MRCYKLMSYYIFGNKSNIGIDIYLFSRANEIVSRHPYRCPHPFKMGPDHNLREQKYWLENSLSKYSKAIQRHSWNIQRTFKNILEDSKLFFIKAFWILENSKDIKKCSWRFHDNFNIRWRFKVVLRAKKLAFDLGLWFETSQLTLQS